MGRRTWSLALWFFPCARARGLAAAVDLYLIADIGLLHESQVRPTALCFWLAILACEVL